MFYHKIIINDVVHALETLQQNNQNLTTPKDQEEGNKKEKSIRIYCQGSAEVEPQLGDIHRKTLKTDESSGSVPKNRKA